MYAISEAALGLAEQSTHLELLLVHPEDVLPAGPEDVRLHRGVAQVLHHLSKRQVAAMVAALLAAASRLRPARTAVRCS